jgi:DNA-binding NarL/FixJ family response regulator
MTAGMASTGQNTWMGQNVWTKEGKKRMMTTVSLTSLERALLRLLVSGYTMEDAAPALGLSLTESERILAELQSRCGVTSFTRLVVLAVLNAWV